MECLAHSSLTPPRARPWERLCTTGFMSSQSSNAGPTTTQSVLPLMLPNLSCHISLSRHMERCSAATSGLLGHTRHTTFCREARRRTQRRPAGLPRDCVGRCKRSPDRSNSNTATPCAWRQRKARITCKVRKRQACRDCRQAGWEGAPALLPPPKPKRQLAIVDYHGCDCFWTAQ